MSLKTLTAALILSVAPFAVSAQCSHGEASQQAMSCIEGSQFDVETGTCIPIAST